MGGGGLPIPQDDLLTGGYRAQRLSGGFSPDDAIQHLLASLVAAAMQPGVANVIGQMFPGGGFEPTPGVQGSAVVAAPGLGGFQQSLLAPPAAGNVPGVAPGSEVHAEPKQGTEA